MQTPMGKMENCRFRYISWLMSWRIRIEDLAFLQHRFFPAGDNAACQKVLQVEKYDYTLHPDAQKLIPRKASEHIPEWRKGACSEEYTYTPTIPASHPKKTASYGKQKKKKAEPHFDQQSVYQEPGYHDFPDDFSADNYSDHTDMVPLDKDSIMS